MFPDRAVGKIKSWRLSAAFVISLLGVGISFWQIPYSKLNVPDALYGPGLVVVFILALLLRVFAVAPFLKVMNVLAASVPAAVVVRVIVEGIMDPTKHNLWPLVVIISTMVGYAVAAPGAILGHLFGRLRSSRKEYDSR